MLPSLLAGRQWPQNQKTNPLRTTVWFSTRAFRAPIRHPSSHAPPSVQSYRPQPRAGSISATEGYSRGPPSRSHVSNSAQFEPPQAIRSRGPPSLQGGYSRPQYGPQSTAASVAGSNYPRPGEQGHYQRSTYAASSVGGRSVGTRPARCPPTLLVRHPTRAPLSVNHVPRWRQHSSPSRHPLQRYTSVSTASKVAPPLAAQTILDVPTTRAAPTSTTPS